MKSLPLSLFLSIILTLFMGMPAFATSKSEALDFLKSWRKQNQDSFDLGAESVRDLLNSSLKVKLSQNETNNTELKGLEERLSNLQKAQSELALQADLVDRLLFQVENRYSGDNDKAFFEQKLLEMAMNEASSMKTSTTPMASFLTYLSIAVRELPEPKENILGFIKNYTEFSSISNPKNPTAFSEQRNYTNGIQNEKAHPVAKDKVGELTEKKINEIESAENPGNTILIKPSLLNSQASSQNILPASRSSLLIADPQFTNEASNSN